MLASEALGIDLIGDTLYLLLVLWGLSCSMSFLPILVNLRFPLDSCLLHCLTVARPYSTLILFASWSIACSPKLHEFCWGWRREKLFVIRLNDSNVHRFGYCSFADPNSTIVVYLDHLQRSFIIRVKFSLDIS